MINDKGFFARLYHATWGRFVYPWLLQRELDAADAEGLFQVRHQLVEQASGDVLEIGAGLAHNLRHYDRQRISNLVLLEPYAPLRDGLRANRMVEGWARNVVDGWGEQLPFQDCAFDTVVMTFVLCTAADPTAVLQEVYRVLKPGGRLLFAEHVRRQGLWGLLQDCIQPLWYLLANGCHCNRRTADVIKSSGLFDLTMTTDTFPKVSWVTRGVLHGVAERSVLSPGFKALGLTEDDLRSVQTS